MLIGGSELSSLFNGYKTSFNSGLSGAKTVYREIAMTVPSSTKSETYGWLGQIPKVREWIGDRHIKGLQAHSYTIVNRKFEDAVSVQRTDIEDDQYGIYNPLFEELGRAAAEVPDELVLSLLSQGFTTTCYDKQFFFDAGHPVRDENGEPQSISNFQDGTEEPWFLMDCSRAVKPLVYQERIPFSNIVRRDEDTNTNVFNKDEYVYGLRGRANAGFGLWQLAYASKAELTPENYEAARAAMMNQRGDEGRPLNIKPDTLVVSPNLEGAAMRLLNNGSRVISVDDGSGGTVVTTVNNEWANTAKPIITPWVNAA